MTCPRCAELEEEIAYLRSELGLDMDRRMYAYLYEEHGLGRGPARLMEALSRANGRIVSKPRVIEMMNSNDKCGKTVDVLVWQARQALGVDVIETIRCQGIRLGLPGICVIAEARAAAAR